MVILSKRNIAFGFAFITLLAGFFIGRIYKVSTAVLEKESFRSLEASLIIEDGEGNVMIFANKPFSSGESVFSLLRRTAEENNFSLEYKDYGESLGVFVNAIAGIENSNDKWWQYWVNGRYASVGVGGYELESKDLVEFKFTNARQ